MDWKIELIKFYESQRLDDMVKKLCHFDRYRDDIKQELIIYLLSMDEEKIIRLIEDNELFYYSYGFIKNQFHSSTSDFFKKYRNYFELNNEKYSDEVHQMMDFDEVMRRQNIIEKVENILNDKVDFFNGFLFRKYFFEFFDDENNKLIKGKSYRKIEIEYSLNSDLKIDHMYIYNSVKDTMQIVKNELKNSGVI